MNDARRAAQAAAAALAEAEARFEKAIAGGAADALVAEVNLAVLRFERGEREEAAKGFRRLIEAYNTRARLSSEELVAVAPPAAISGADDPQLFKDALKAFDEAIAADPDNIDARVRLAELFLEKYNSDGRGGRRSTEALGRNPTIPRALARRWRACRTSTARPASWSWCERSLEANPNLAAARVFQAELLLEQEDYRRRGARGGGASSPEPGVAAALSVLAAARYLQGDRPRFEEAREEGARAASRARASSTTVAELCVRNRLYAEAVDFAQAGASRSTPRSWRALGLLGLNQLRLGPIEEGREEPRGVVQGRPLQRLDQEHARPARHLPAVRTRRRRAHFRALRRTARKSALLAPYVASWRRRPTQRLAARYGYRPPTPDPDRGLPEPRATSRCARSAWPAWARSACASARVLAIDSPSARESGQFNWGSTLWHELAHTFTLGVTDAPRAALVHARGCPCCEERRARPGWGDDAHARVPDRAQGRASCCRWRELNDGFVRPDRSRARSRSRTTRPRSSCELIEQQRGFPAVLELLDAYSEGRDTAAGASRRCSAEPTLDKSFDASASASRSRFAVRSPRRRRPRRRGRARARARETASDFLASAAPAGALPAEEAATRRRHASSAARGPLPGVRRRGRARTARWPRSSATAATEGAAAAELAQLTAHQRDDHYRAHLELAELQEELGDAAARRPALERALYIWPFDPALHERLAALYAALGDRAGVVRARRPLVALEPVDRPEALYQLALALRRGGRRAGRAPRGAARAGAGARASSAPRSCCCACTRRARRPGGDAREAPAARAGAPWRRPRLPAAARHRRPAGA